MRHTHILAPKRCIDQRDIDHAGDREQWQHQRETDQQHDPGPENRRRIAEQCQQRDEMAEEPVWPPGRDHAKNHADDKRENLCRENKQQRRRKTLGDQACHRRVEEEAVAEIQPDNIAKIESKLHQKGLVEAVISPDLCHHLFGGAAHVTGNGVGDITRRDMDQREIENNDGQQ